MLIADWEELEKNVASEVEGRFICPCADGSIKQVRHVVLRPQRFRDYLNKKIRMREETPTLKDLLNIPAAREETLSQKNLSHGTREIRDAIIIRGGTTQRSQQLVALAWEGSHTDRFSRQDHLHTQRHRVRQSLQRADVHQQRPRSCRSFQGSQARLFVVHWTRI